MGFENRARATIDRTRMRGMGSRRGVSVLEVLFATGIAISGLLGIAALLLMSGRDAAVANQATESQALARTWYSDFLARGLHHPGRWLRYQDYDYTFGATTHPVGWYLAGKVLPGGVRPTFSSGSQPPLHVLTPGKISVCIDPYFFNSRDVRPNLYSTSSWYKQPAPGGSNWYRPAVFPYYQDGHNPLIDPRITIGAANANSWSDQPRMMRVAITSTSGSLVPMVDAMVRRLFVSQDELIIMGDEELDRAGVTRPAPAMRRFRPLNGAIPGTAGLENGYSWLATLSPLEQTDTSTENLYTLSLVVIKDRERVFLPSVRTGGSPDPTSTPQGEKLIWVNPPSAGANFVGGNGGRVQLLFSSAMEEKIRVGDWLMLSKHVAFNQISSAPVTVAPFSIFRWYRVVAVDGEATLLPANSVTDPYGNANPEPIWMVNVALAGPDWSFSSPTAGIPTPTTATLVKGATAVYERVIEIPDL